MQRLANVANRVRPAIVLVQKAATTREIEQRQAQLRRNRIPLEFLRAAIESAYTLTLGLGAPICILVLLYGHKSQFI
jgi:hypothetical protein